MPDPVTILHRLGFLLTFGLPLPVLAAVVALAVIVPYVAGVLAGAGRSDA